MERMKGKYAVITGGNSGIGAATARVFAREGAAGIAILNRKRADKPGFEDLANELKEMGVNAVAIPCDVSDPDQVEAAVRQAAETFGRIDVAVNSAGMLDFNSSVLRTSDELWDKTIAINQSGLFYSCREELKQMEKQGEGVIINISSVAGVSGNSGAAYSSSKHAVVSLTRNIAIQYTGTKIRCNAILPGPTVTAMTDLAPEDAGPDGLPKDPPFDSAFTHICQRHVDTSIGFLDADDQAYAILFFASDEAKSINGQWICVDKGFY